MEYKDLIEKFNKYLEEEELKEDELSSPEAAKAGSKEAGLSYDEEELEKSITDNRKGATKTFHAPANSPKGGQFVAKKDAGSVSYGHYGSGKNAGKLQLVKSKNGKPSPRMPNQKCGSVATGAHGGIGKHQYKCSTKEKVWEESLDVKGAHLKAMLTEKQRLEKELAKLNHKIEWLQADIASHSPE